MESTRAWLAELGLDQYAQAFADNDIDLEILEDLSDSDLEKLGVASMGHRKRILRAVKEGFEAQPEPGHESAQEAERRQLTVMFCDLVGSTALSEQLDPEDLRELNRAYQEAVAAEVERFDGLVARYMGDGVLAYFGYPQAHEDDAERSVRAGLAIQRAASGLRARFHASHGAEMGVRIGIATGLVVVGDVIGQGASRESPVVGQTPNLAARLEALATPGSVVISPVTKSLLGGLFDFQDLGTHQLKGIAAAVNAWQVLGESTVAGRAGASRTFEQRALIGREQELARIEQVLARACLGRGQVVLLSAEPGFGKSHLVSAFEARSAVGGATFQFYACSAYHRETPLHPLVRPLWRTAQFEADDSDQRRTEKLEALVTGDADTRAVDLAVLAELVGSKPVKKYPLPDQRPGVRKQNALQVLLQHILARTGDQPTVIVIEDAQWLDPTSIEFVGLLMSAIQTKPVLLLITFRPEFAPPWDMVCEPTSIELGKLAAAEVEQIVEARLDGKTLPEVAIREIVSRSDGVPLFVEELTRTVVTSELLVDRGTHFDLAAPHLSFAIPNTVQDSLMASLDRVGPAKVVAQMAAVIGRRFSSHLLGEVARAHGVVLRNALETLCAADILTADHEAGSAHFMFRHGLLHDVAYGSLLKKTRQEMHATIAGYIEANDAEFAELAPELLARHHDEAGNRQAAFACWLRAGQRSAGRGANLEAISHLHHALDALRATPESTGRGEYELVALKALGPVLLASKGWTSDEAKQVHQRAREICELIGDRRQAFDALWGIWLFSTASADVASSYDVLDELFRIAELENDRDLLMEAHHASWGTITWLGKFDTALEHVEKGLAIYDPERHRAHASRFGGHDPGVCGKCQEGISRWFIGQVDRALDCCEEGLRWSRQMSHAPTEAHALNWVCNAHLFRREAGAVMARGEELVRLSNQQGFVPFAIMGARMLGWAKMQCGELEAGLAELESAIARARSIGFLLSEPFNLTLLASGYARMGRLDDAAAELERALTMLQATGELLWEPEVLRVQGEVARQSGPDGDARARRGFEQAIAIAQSQGSKSFHLRAATSLARLQLDEGDKTGGCATLIPVFEQFSQGRNTRDLIDASALIVELSS